MGLRQGRATLVVAIVLSVFVLVPAAPTAADEGGSTGAAAGRIAVGDAHACAIAETDQIWCWGSNSYGALGVSINTRPAAAVIVRAGFVPTSVSVNGNHSCAVSDEGEVWCWGDNDDGQLGPGLNFADEPVRIAGLDDATSVAVASRHICATTAQGGVYCWGNNDFGQLGDGTTTSTDLPVAVSGISGVATVSTTGTHTCALATSGSVSCWGRGIEGELGNGSLSNSSRPVAVSQLNDAIALSVGRQHSCAIRASGSVVCWGRNELGQVGDGTTRNDRSTPVDVAGPDNVVTIGSGDNHTCALEAAGTLWCWGSNNNGELGSVGEFADGSPPLVAGLVPPDAAELAIGRFGCALVGDGIACWGSNFHGNLGDGTENPSALPVAVVEDATRAPVSLAPAPGARGDADCDGSSGLADARFVAQAAIESRTVFTACPLPRPDEQVSAANSDFDGDGRVTLADARLVAQCAIQVAGIDCSS